MNPSSPSTVFERYLAVDLHKQYVMVGGVNAQQVVVLQPRRVELEARPTWAKKNLLSTDALVIEATINARDFYDETRPYVGRMVVANAMKVKLIAQTRVKTDKHDTLALAHLLMAGLIPEVWVPPVEVRELRGLIAHRRQMVKRRTTPALAFRCKCGEEPPPQSVASAPLAPTRRRPFRQRQSRVVGGTQGLAGGALAS